MSGGALQAGSAVVRSSSEHLILGVVVAASMASTFRKSSGTKPQRSQALIKPASMSAAPQASNCGPSVVCKFP
jgi:hypothetical protein